MRYWIVDNSGSMATADGHQHVRSGMKVKDVTVTRWQELADSIQWHATTAINLQAPTEFRLLNSPGGLASQKVPCGTTEGDAAEQMAAVKAMLSTSPNGRTPLCEQIREVTEDIKAHSAEWRAAGKRCVLVIASDGAATDGDVQAAMRPLLSLPVWVVVRLCTDDDNVVEYWNRIDEDLELDMDVLDDLSSEAKEVCEHSPWLVYGAPLHRLREWGCVNKLFDVIDEKALSAAEMKDMIALLLGGAAADLPHPQIDWLGFEQGVMAVLKTAPTTYDALKKREGAWIDVNKLRNKYTANGSYCCVIS